MCNDCKNCNNTYNNNSFNQQSGKRFINDDVKLIYGARIAARISEKELWDKIYEKYVQLGTGYVNILPYKNADEYSDDDRFEIISLVLLECETICSDYDSFDFIVPDSIEKERFVTFENGLTCLEFDSCGDEDILPVYGIIYFDGEDLRCYVPKYGNTIDLDNHKSFDNSDDDDIGYDFTIEYCARYGYSDIDDVEYCKDAMIKDITAMFIVK